MATSFMHIAGFLSFLSPSSLSFGRGLRLGRAWPFRSLRCFAVSLHFLSPALKSCPPSIPRRRLQRPQRTTTTTTQRLNNSTTTRRTMADTTGAASTSPRPDTENETTTKKQKTYHTKATGPALETVQRHSQERDLKLFGSCFW